MFIANWLRSKNLPKSRLRHTNPTRKRGPYCLESLEPRAMLATFQGLGDAPGGPGFQSEARAISGDGLTVVGTGFRWTQAGGMVGMAVTGQDVSFDGSVIVGGSGEAFRWTEAGGVVSLGDLPGGSVSSAAWTVSNDGSVIAGHGTSDIIQEGFRWTEGTGMVGLGSLPGETQGSIMQGISGDGAVIVGRGNEGSGCCGGVAVKWTEGGGMVSLGRLPGRTNSRASGASSDGSVIVGWSGEAFRWTATDGMQGLGILPGMNESWAFDVTADGSVIVGRSYDDSAGLARAFIWDETNGMRDLQNVLASDYGLANALDGWELSYSGGTPDISADGTTISGTGINPIGLREAWVVNLTPFDPGAPTVDAGANQTILVNQAASLDGTVTDNNGPPAPTVQWSVISGPGTVTFADDTAEDTTATFSTTGTYGLKLEATDGALTSADYVYVTVNPLSADLTSTADTYISNASKESTKNFGGATGLVTDGNPDKSTLVRWDLSGIPAGSVVHSATLSVNVSGTSGDTYEIYEVLQNWAESQATWTKATSTTNWSTAGAQGAAHGTTVLGTISAPTAGVRTIALGADGLAAVQRWINMPSSNFGLILQDYANSTNDDLVISSRETGTSANCPRLILTYDPPVGSPSSVVVSVSEARTPAAEMRVSSARQHRVAVSATVSRVSASQGTSLDAASVDATMRLYATRRPRITRELSVSAP
jgi:probable HAF family extracellular repeat protein